jgi:hypothetical protein
MGCRGADVDTDRGELDIIGVPAIIVLWIIQHIVCMAFTMVIVKEPHPRS